MKAADIMTRNALTVGRETSVAQAIRLMLDNNVSGLPVLADDGKVIGILTEGDLLRRSEMGTERHRPRWLEIFMGPGRMASEYVRTHGRKVEEIMTTDLISVTGDTPLDEVVGLMERRRIKRVPVLDGDALVGVVSRTDLLRSLLHTLEAQHSETRRDDEILEQILAELAKAAWVPRDGLSISVNDGIVDLNGVILEKRSGRRCVSSPRMHPASEASRITSSGSNRCPELLSNLRRRESERRQSDNFGRNQMRAFLLGSVAVLGLAAGLQTAAAAPSLSNSPVGGLSRNEPVASHQCGKGQHWVPSGYAKHGKYRVGHCAPN